MNRCQRPLCLFMIACCVISLTSTESSAQQVKAVSRVTPSKTRHPLDDAIELAQRSLDHIRSNVEDYTALFVKRCRVNGELPPLQFAKIKIRNRKVNDGMLVTPMSVYLDFLKPSSVRGREVIWVENRNDNKLVAHATGVGSLINVHLDPNGYVAMRGQRYPITEIGIENLVAKVVETGLRDRQHGECDVQFFRDAKIGDTKCIMVQVTHPVQRDHFDFYRARVYFDEERLLPIRYESWSWPETPEGDPVLEEEYTYLQLATNVGLSDYDFDIANPEYRFR